MQSVVGMQGQGIRIQRQLGPGRNAFELTIDRLDLRAGDRLALIGPNGCGKTTALSVLSLALEPDSCQKFDLLTADGGEPVSPMGRGASQVRRHSIGIAQQTGGDIAFLTVRDRIGLRLRLARSNNKRQRLQQALSDFGLEELAARKPHQLSQGQRQRVSLATACAITPRFAFADEPTAAMDSDWSERTLAHLSRLSARAGTCVVIATHDPDQAQRHGFSLVSLSRNSSSASAGSRLVLSGQRP